ncbi:unnamed protein product [Rhizoctonia solani]|uniref:Protein kinase domain-containing protein n=1 Tax=Rhizoctonia solani TaxID=456999 RepID=A0A8H3HPC7_9AGAM|nr:unnamed protein product [Rhizoctonia solani]
MEYITKHPDVDRPELCTQIACGLAYLHSMGTIHGDIKGENVLVAQNGVAMLTDFGSTILKNYSIKFSGDQVNGLSIRWAAPEHLMGVRGLGSKPADVYSLGMRVEVKLWKYESIRSL